MTISDQYLSTADIAKQTGSFGAGIQLESFKAFADSFPLSGEGLYQNIFDRHADIVQTQKAKFAVANLEKIFSATFAESSVSGFDRMSLRDLSKTTGMSMGAIYSCISKKEDIALIVADIVRLSSELTHEQAMSAGSPWEQIEQSIRFHLYASTLLQPWYFFLYFETCCLPEQQKLDSKKIELDAIAGFEKQIKRGLASKDFQTNQVAMVANIILVLLEDWYLKPWKNMAFSDKISRAECEQKIDDYHQSITSVVRKLLSYQGPG